MSFRPMDIPSFDTERLVLRGLENSDLDGFVEIHGDDKAGVWRHLPPQEFKEKFA